MIGSDVLLFPDTGEQFARCLKTATLYSERIYCVSAAAPEIQEIFANEGLEPGESTLKFLAAAEQHEGDFALLRRENILPQEDAFSSWDEPSDEEWNAAFIDVLLHGIIRDHVVKHLVRSGKTNASSFSYSRRNRAMNDSPPAAWFAFQDLLRSSVISEDMKEVKKKIGASTFERILYDLYLKGLVTMADLNGVSILTHSEVFARSINDARNQPSFTRNPTHEDTAKAFLESLRLHQAGNTLAHTLLKRALPRVDDLSLEDVLELRLKHKDEVQAFRVGLGEIASQVDLSRDTTYDAVQLERLILGKVDPAIQDLRVAINNTKLNMVRSYIAGPTIGLALSVIGKVTQLGSDIALNLLATLFPIARSVFSAHLDRKRLKNESRWSLVLELEKN